MQPQRNRKKSDKSQLTLTAVAFQDHICQQMGYPKSHPRSSLTLAQKLGVVPGPTPPLTSVQWEKAKEISRVRGDSAHPCPICQDEFRLQDQVLLSCTHTFHKSCLKAFERYSGKKRCPICRCPSYQTTPINAGATAHRITAAIKIQSTWRGYRDRRRYLLYRRDHPPMDSALREKYFASRLTNMTNQLVGACSSTHDSAHQLLTSIDKDLSCARQVLSEFDKKFIEIPNWDDVIVKASSHFKTDCPICLTPLSLPRPLTVLSCSHLYHTQCIEALESFTDDRSLHTCPTCRIPYISKHIKQ